QEEKQTAQKPQTKNITDQLSKLGTTIFAAETVEIDFSQEFFFPASKLADWRRQLIDKLIEARRMTYPQSLRDLRKKPVISTAPEEKELSYLANVSNNAAKAFYEQRGFTRIQPAFEIQSQENVPLMFMKHCIRYSLGCCSKIKGNKEKLKEPLYLVNKSTRLRLEFDCKQCEMRIYKDNEQK
ncbi:MAG: DUF3656 domain-containing protein, partial [Bacteroidales bacterium]